MKHETTKSAESKRPNAGARISTVVDALVTTGEPRSVLELEMLLDRDPLIGGKEDLARQVVKLVFSAKSVINQLKLIRDPNNSRDAELSQVTVDFDMYQTEAVRDLIFYLQTELDPRALISTVRSQMLKMSGVSEVDAETYITELSKQLLVEWQAQSADNFIQTYQLNGSAERSKDDPDVAITSGDLSRNASIVYSLDDFEQSTAKNEPGSIVRSDIVLPYIDRYEVPLRGRPETPTILWGNTPGDKERIVIYFDFGVSLARGFTTLRPTRYDEADTDNLSMINNLFNDLNAPRYSTSKKAGNLATSNTS
jgi:hypothetical protein